MSDIRNYICPVCGMPMSKEQQVCSQCSYKIKWGESITNYCAKHGGIWHNYEIEKPMVEGIKYKICVVIDSWNGMQNFDYRNKKYDNGNFECSLSECVISWFEPQENNSKASLINFLKEWQNTFPDTDVSHLQEMILKNNIKIFDKEGNRKPFVKIIAEINKCWNPTVLISADQANKRSNTNNTNFIEKIFKVQQDILYACDKGEYEIVYDDFLPEKAIDILKNKGYKVECDYGQGQACTKISWK